MKRSKLILISDRHYICQNKEREFKLDLFLMLDLHKDNVHVCLVEITRWCNNEQGKCTKIR